MNLVFFYSILAQHSDRGSFGEVSWVEMLTIELSIGNLPVTIEFLKVRLKWKSISFTEWFR